MTENTTEPRSADAQTDSWVEDEFDSKDGPAGYGIQDPEHPGEPDYWSHPVSNPVPDTGKQTRDEREGTRGGRHDTTEGEGHRSSSGGR